MEADADTDDAGSNIAETTFGGDGNSTNSTTTTAPLLGVVIDVPNSDTFVELAPEQASASVSRRRVTPRESLRSVIKADAMGLVAEEPSDTPNDESKDMHTPHSASNKKDKVLKETT